MRLLIVDDEPLARERLRRMVEELPGAEVVGEAGDGRAALEACARLHPEVVLLDIRMPGMDGLEAARHLATLPEGPAVIFITAYGDYALQAFEAQAVDYLLKPVRAEQKYVVVRHLRGESLIEDSLTALEAEYGPRFVRIHRNALVARSALEGLEKGADGTARVRLRGCEERPEISRRHLPELRRLLRSGEI
jgi:two-component system response regulator AlgR